MIKKTQQSGFTLFQMAFLVAAVGVIVGALFANWNTAQGTNALVVTQERQSRIAIALSDYLQTYGRLPCPGNLAGDLQSAGREVGPPCAAQEGILPYRTLGLNPLDVYDGWGNLFTYAVQVDIRGNNLGVAGNVYDQCRRSAGQSPWVPVATNMNPIKANICCRSVLNANRLRVLDAAAVPNDLVARVEGKSSLGRLGLLIHSTAGFVDAGFDGHITLELANVANLPITLYPGMKIGQVSFMKMTSPAEKPYGSGAQGSKYQGQRGPTPSRYFENFQ